MMITITSIIAITAMSCTCQVGYGIALNMYDADEAAWGRFCEVPCGDGLLTLLGLHWTVCEVHCEVKVRGEMRKIR